MDTGESMEPTPVQLKNLQKLCNEMLEHRQPYPAKYAIGPQDRKEFIELFERLRVCTGWAEYDASELREAVFYHRRVFCDLGLRSLVADTIPRRIVFLNENTFQTVNEEFPRALISSVLAELNDAYDPECTCKECDGCGQIRVCDHCIKPTCEEPVCTKCGVETTCGNCRVDVREEDMIFLSRRFQPGVYCGTCNKYSNEHSSQHDHSCEPLTKAARN